MHVHLEFVLAVGEPLGLDATLELLLDERGEAARLDRRDGRLGQAQVDHPVDGFQAPGVHDRGGRGGRHCHGDSRVGQVQGCGGCVHVHKVDGQEIILYHIVAGGVGDWDS